MGLRNAFEEMATEGTLRQLVRIFQEGRFMPYSKDLQDRMRIIVDNQPAIANYLANTSGVPGSSNVTPWGNNTGLLMDDRAEAQDFTFQNFNFTRNRWSIT